MIANLCRRWSHSSMFYLTYPLHSPTNDFYVTSLHSIRQQHKGKAQPSEDGPLSVVIFYLFYLFLVVPGIHHPWLFTDVA